VAAVEALHTIGVGYAQGFVIAKPESLWHLAANVGP
jgi:EAL domain-containing protein (putative c-di-GMP-specific phosphodiesterase class I)